MLSYEVDPLTCPKCKGRMRILAFIEDEEVIKKILKHLGLWDQKARPPPKATATPPDLYIDEPVSKRSSLFKVKEGENFNRRNTLSILRIKI